MSLTSCKNQELTNSINWHIAGELPPMLGQNKAPGLAGPVTGVSNNALLIAGGANFPDSLPWMGGRKKYYSEGFVFIKNEADSLQFITNFTLPDTIAYAAPVSTSYGIVIAGGENKNGTTAKVYLAQWVADSVLFKPLANLPIPLANAGITTTGNKVYLVGGENSDAASAGFYVLDISREGNQWQPLPSYPHAVSHAVVTALESGDAGIYVMGGRKKNPNGISNLYNDAWRFDFKKQQWEPLASLPYTLCAGTGAAYGNNAIYLFGGDRGETFHNTEELIAAIRSATDEVKKEELTRAKNILQESHPGFSHEILVYHPSDNSWSVAGQLPFDTPVTTTAIVWGNNVIIPSGEIRAGVRTAQILMGKR